MFTNHAKAWLSHVLSASHYAGFHVMNLALIGKGDEPVNLQTVKDLYFRHMWQYNEIPIKVRDLIPSLEEKRPVEISEAKPPVPASAIAGSLTDDYMEFLERGKRLGISLVTMSIILPEKTRRQLLTEQLDRLRSEKMEGH